MIFPSLDFGTCLCLNRTPRPPQEPRPEDGEPGCIGEGYRKRVNVARDLCYRELILTADPHAEPFYTPCGWLANGPQHVHRSALHSVVSASSNSGYISGEERQRGPLDDSGVPGRARSRVALQE